MNLRGVRFPHGSSHYKPSTEDLLEFARWPYFWSALGLMLLCFVVSVVLGKVKIGNFPANPLYWYLWVLANAENRLHKNVLISRLRDAAFISFWMVSIIALILAMFVLLAILNN